MYPMIVKAKFWDEIEGKDTDNIFFVYADKMSNAIEQISDWVGEENLLKAEIECFDDGIISVDENFVKYLRKEKGFNNEKEM